MARKKVGKFKRYKQPKKPAEGTTGQAPTKKGTGSAIKKAT